MPRNRQFPRRLFGEGVRLAAIETSTEGEPKNPRWIQIAYEGEFRGYHSGPVEFTRETFEMVVRNFRNHPTYKANPGEANVVHFDYEHASEMDPRAGSIPEKGAPAPAWVRELEVRDGADGAELWALAYLGKTILSQITADPPEYQWTSVGLAPDSLDPKTGKHTGPLLTSVAFTNDPFLQGMVPISIAASMSVWVDKAETPEEALLGVREIFGLPSDATSELIAEHFQRFVDMLRSGVEVEGVELEDILGALRRLFAMPTLASREEVISAVQAALSYDPNATTPTTPANNAATNAETQMELTKRLAAQLKVNEKDELILAAVEKATMAADAMDTLMGILGSADFKTAIEAAKGLVEKTSGMGEIVTQLAAAMERIGQVDGQDAEAEAEAVVASRVAQMGLSGNAAKVARDSLRPAILEMRRNCIDPDPKVMGEKLAKFRQTYPLPEADRAMLTRRVFAGAGGAQFGLQADAAGNLTPVPVAPPTTSNAPARSDGRNPARIALCRDFSGRNEVEKAVAYLRKEQPDFASKDYMAQVRRAGEWLSSN